MDWHYHGRRTSSAGTKHGLRPASRTNTASVAVGVVVSHHRRPGIQPGPVRTPATPCLADNWVSVDLLVTVDSLYYM